MSGARVNVDCGQEKNPKRIFDDSRMAVILISIVGFLGSGMIVAGFAQLNGKADKEYLDTKITAVNEKIDNKFDTIIRLLQQHEESSRKTGGR